MFNDESRKQCIVCGGEVPLGACQSVTTRPPWGEFTVYYHSACATTLPNGMDEVISALKELAEKNKPKEKK